MKSQTTIEIFLNKFQNISNIYTKAVNSSETKAKKELYTNLNAALEIIFKYNKPLNEDQDIGIEVNSERFDDLEEILTAKSPDSFWWILNSIQKIYKSTEGYNKNSQKYLEHIVHAFGAVEMIGSNIINIPDEQLA